MKKKTAVEWLIAEIQRLPLEHRLEKQHLYAHALEMEKEQIMEVFLDGYKSHPYMAEQYYNETYRGDK